MWRVKYYWHLILSFTIQKITGEKKQHKLNSNCCSSLQPQLRADWWAAVWLATKHVALALITVQKERHKFFVCGNFFANTTSKVLVCERLWASVHFVVEDILACHPALITERLDKWATCITYSHGPHDCVYWHQLSPNIMTNQWFIISRAVHKTYENV